VRVTCPDCGRTVAGAMDATPTDRDVLRWISEGMDVYQADEPIVLERHDPACKRVRGSAGAGKKGWWEVNLTNEELNKMETKWMLYDKLQDVIAQAREANALRAEVEGLKADLKERKDYVEQLELLGQRRRAEVERLRARVAELEGGIELTVGEISDLCMFADSHESDPETEITVARAPVGGVEGDCTRWVAWFSEYPDEGSQPLGQNMMEVTP
jgi:hypothetical protein